MADLIENDELPGSLDAFTEETKKTPEVPAEEKAPVFEVPEKYKGKALEDIVRMHQEAEKLIGKQAQEVGEVRKLADELLKQQLSSVKKEEPKETEEEVDFFVDPKTAVKKAVESHPAVKAAKEATERLERQERTKTLAQKHPDMMTVVQAPEFQEWVKSSKVRTALFVAADQNFDTDAADELLTTFKALKGIQAQKATTEVKQAAEETRKQALQAASVDTSGTGEVAKKVYRRADLIRLKIQDPNRYESLQDEIMAAYAEGRVK